VLVRFSTVGGERICGYRESSRGFAIKFYTKMGWDLVGNNAGFFVKGAKIKILFIQKIPTNMKSNDDVGLLVAKSESLHQVLILSDRGTPYGYRHMNNYGSHLFDAGRC
jgi:catalase